MSRCHRVVMFLGIFLFPLATALGQLSGLRGGLSRGNEPGLTTHGMQDLTSEVVQSYIRIDGQAELRVEPTRVRVVLAVTAEGKTPAECNQLVSERIEALTTALRKTGIPQEDIVEDFIAVLPRYDFAIERIHDQEVAREEKVGYLMQSNLHLAVDDDAEAMSAVNIAFENNVSDIIAFDYWNEGLDELKIKARAQAVKAAREKAEVLLGALFEKLPPIINLQESTKVYYPESLYESFANSSDADYQTSYSRRDMPQIRTFRPKNTYYRGLYLDADVQSKELPMRAEISVVSTVRLYFESPVAKEYRLTGKVAQ